MQDELFLDLDKLFLKLTIFKDEIIALALQIQDHFDQLNIIKLLYEFRSFLCRLENTHAPPLIEL
jgi:hypothetical protein